MKLLAFFALADLCRCRKRKQVERGIRIDPDYRRWPEAYRWKFFRSVALDMLGPNANLVSPLGRAF